MISIAEKIPNAEVSDTTEDATWLVQAHHCSWLTKNTHHFLTIIDIRRNIIFAPS